MNEITSAKRSAGLLNIGTDKYICGSSIDGECRTTGEPSAADVLGMLVIACSCFFASHHDSNRQVNGSRRAKEQLGTDENPDSVGNPSFGIFSWCFPPGADQKWVVTFG